MNHELTLEEANKHNLIYEVSVFDLLPTSKSLVTNLYQYVGR